MSASGALVGCYVFVDGNEAAVKEWWYEVVFQHGSEFRVQWMCDVIMNLVVSDAGAVAWIQGAIAIQEVPEGCYHSSVRLAG